MLGPPHPGAQPGANDRPPPELAAHFTVVALVSQGLSWLFLGMVTACGYNHYHSAYLMVGNSAPMSDVEEYADSRGEPDVIGWQQEEAQGQACCAGDAQKTTTAAL
ncbi:unnamed protein product [Polarella glacialis]|uniref:Uncharacterized protein n=1 Tax=Polarella glacialis TaxID=89957 RepID=A0A813HTV8_POLGL|nr:unnamed protein product [Polarella glacialis]